MEPTNRPSRPSVQTPREWGSIIKAVQGNFDHLMGLIRTFGKAHNSLVDDVSDMRDALEGSIDSTTRLEAVIASGDTAEHAHDGSGSDGGLLSQGVLRMSGGGTFGGEDGDEGPMGPRGPRGLDHGDVDGGSPTSVYGGLELVDAGGI